MFLNKRINEIKNDFSKYFDFLGKDFGMKMVNEILPNESTENYILIFKNKYVQVELAGDTNYFYAQIRRLVNDTVFPYSDSKNNINFVDLVILLTNHNYEHLDYYVPSVGWESVLDSAANLFKKCKEVFTTDGWVDIEKIENLKDEDFFKKYGHRPSKKPSFFDILKKEAKKILIDKGYKLVFDSSELPPYNSESLFQKVIFKESESKIEISQRDWRDNYTEYYIEKNEKNVFEIDLSKFHGDIIKASNIMVDKLKEITN